MEDIIQAAKSKSFTEFEEGINSALQEKMKNHVVMQSYSKELEKMVNLKSKFKEINDISKED